MQGSRYEDAGSGKEQVIDEIHLYSGDIFTNNKHFRVCFHGYRQKARHTQRLSYPGSNPFCCRNYRREHRKYTWNAYIQAQDQALVFSLRNAYNTYIADSTCGFSVLKSY